MGIEREIYRQLEKRRSQGNYDTEDSSRSCSPDDNRKFASSAIAFVIKHSRKGIVPLCASVAELMQDKESLQKEVRELQRKLNAFHEWLQSPPSTSHTPAYVEQNNLRASEKQISKVKRSLQPVEVKENVVRNKLGKDTKWTNFGFGGQTFLKVPYELKDFKESENKEYKENEKNYPAVPTRTIVSCIEKDSGEKHVLVPGPLLHCGCTSCIQSGAGDGFALRTRSCDLNLTLMDGRVLAEGDLLGWIRYVGHVDGSTLADEVVVGIELDEPIGESNGCYKGHQYFQCGPLKGLFLPISSIMCIQKQNITSPPS